MRNSNRLLIFFIFTSALLALLVLHGQRARKLRGNEIASCSDMVRAYQLTDLCLFTEARYTRNPAMADMFSPFQDQPASLDHFPSGSLVTPPRPMERHEQ